MNRALLLVLFMTAPLSASAATVSLTAEPSSVGVGDLVRVSVMVGSAIPTNTFSGTLLYPPSLAPVSASDGNSIVPLWVIHPDLSSSGKISFAGIVPGGFSGTGGLLFSVLFRAEATGKTALSLSDVTVLRNDGKGGSEPTTVRPLSLSILSRPSGGYTEPADAVPPEPFSPELGSDPSLFYGRAYLVFSAVDKGSGIDHYLVAESRLPVFLHFLLPLSYATATSPYELKDQAGTSAVYVQAVDRAGNARLAVFPPQRFLTVREGLFLLILIGVALLWHLIRRRSFR